MNFENAKEVFLKSFSLPLGYAAWETDEVSKLQGAHLLQINDKSNTVRTRLPWLELLFSVRFVNLKTGPSLEFCKNFLIVCNVTP